MRMDKVMKMSTPQAQKPSLMKRIATELQDPQQIEKQLSAPKGIRADLSTSYLAPRTPLEKWLAQLWAEVLEIDRVGVHDDFYALGGDSLLATRIISRAQETFQAEVPLKVLYADVFTIAKLAQAIETDQLEHAEEAEIAVALKELEGLSDEEVRAFLAEEEK